MNGERYQEDIAKPGAAERTAAAFKDEKNIDPGVGLRPARSSSGYADARTPALTTAP
jgi:hypothetical protein